MHHYFHPINSSEAVEYNKYGGVKAIIEVFDVDQSLALTVRILNHGYPSYEVPCNLMIFVSQMFGMLHLEPDFIPRGAEEQKVLLSHIRLYIDLWTYFSN